jgi:hypothetical protein
LNGVLRGHIGRDVLVIANPVPGVFGAVYGNLSEVWNYGWADYIEFRDMKNLGSQIYRKMDGSDPGFDGTVMDMAKGGIGEHMGKGKVPVFNLLSVYDMQNGDLIAYSDRAGGQSVPEDRPGKVSFRRNV